MLKDDPDPLIRQIVDEEGERSHVYPDSLGIMTIGVGRNVDAKAGGPGLRGSEIRQMLLNDIAERKEHLDIEIPWWRSEDDVRQRVMIDLAFNMGINGLLGFHHMLSAWNHQDYAEATRCLLASQWATQVQTSRRNRLAIMLKTGTQV